jgi:hypothetical protein
MDTAVSNRFIPWLLIGLTLLTFGRVVNDGFAPYDDELTIRDNPRMNPVQFTSDGVLWYWNNPAMSLYIPLTYTVWGAIAAASRVHGDDPTKFILDAGNFHVASLLLHMACVLLVFAILRRLLKRPWPAAAGALLYALHPLQVETVAWASGMKDLLSAALSLAAIWFYLRAVAPEIAPVAPLPDPDEAIAPRLDWRFYSLALLCFILAMLAKPSAMMTPAILLIIDALLLRRGVERTVRTVVPFIALALPIAFIARSVQPGTGLPAPELWQRPVVAGASLAFYLQKLILPIGLTFDYGWRPVEMLHKTWFYGIAVIPLVLAIVVGMMRKRWPWVCAGALIFLAVLLPVLGFVPFKYQIHSTVGDHYVYFAMLGPALILAWGLSKVAKHTRIAMWITGAALLMLAVLSVRQLSFWHDEEATLRRTLAINPASDLALNNLGQIYVRKRDFPEAERLFKAAVASNPPDLIAPLTNLVIIYKLTGRPDDAIRAFYELKRANERLPEAKRVEYSDDIFFKAGLGAARIGHMTDAIRYFQEAVRVAPRDPRPKEALRQAQAYLKSAATRRSTTTPARP